MNYIGTIEDDKLTTQEQLVIYGAGKVGRHVLEILSERGLREKVACFCDNSPKLRGAEIDGIRVYCAEEACGRYPEGTYLVASVCVRRMVESLLQYGIEDIHIIRES